MHSSANSDPAKDKIIVALDLPDETSALAAVEKLTGEVGLFKIGLQLFTACGPNIVRQIRALGGNVFLDLKFHDIPNTVRHAVESAVALDVQMLTVHAGGGREMLVAAATGAAGSATTVLGVTVLTSSNAQTLAEMGVNREVSDQVEALGKIVAEAGLGGLVASAHEIGLLRRYLPRSIKLVIPGIRPVGAETQDQKRVMTPLEAITAGADYLVIGRPILQAADPVAAAREIAASFALDKSLPPD